MSPATVGPPAISPRGRLTPTVAANSIPAWSGDESSFAQILAKEIVQIHHAYKGNPALMSWNAFNEGWGEGSPAMVNTTMQLLRNLSRPTRDNSMPCPFPAKEGCRSVIDSIHLLNDASGGRGFGCGAGWVDPDKCPTGPDGKA